MVLILLPGRQPFPLYFCSNSYYQISDSQPLKSYKLITLTLAISLIIHILVQMRIMIHKAKESSVQPAAIGLTMARRQQNLDDWNLTSFIANICCLLSTGLILLTTFQFSHYESLIFNQVKYYWLFFCLYLRIQNLIIP